MDYEKKFILGDLVKGQRTFNNEIIEGKFNGFHLHDKLDPTSVIGVICVENDRCYDVVAGSIKLLESDDEKIRKAIIECVKNYGPSTANPQLFKNMLAWLEKQGEQKPIDEVKSKLKVGDWITFCGSEQFKILEVEPEQNGILNYLLLEPSGRSAYHDKKYVDENARLWTIQDAKDGDVLVTSFEEDNMIVIYHSMCTIDTINVHCCLDNKFICENLGVFDAEDVKPATKEQHDTLMKAIADAGYEWDFEKKELKKIQKKPVWGKEDEEYLQNIVEWIGCLIDDEDCGDMTYKEHKEFYLKRINWLNSLKERIKEK